MPLGLRLARLTLDSPGYTAEDLTPAVLGLIRRQRLTNGVVTLYAASPGTAVVLIEYEPELLKDLEELIASLGGRSPVVSEALLGKEASAPVVRGSLETGRFKNFVFIDLSRSPGEKEVVAVLEGVFEGG
ncbi:MAG: hypothetical protein DRO39_03715 [Thermoprotei archaeon]|nr:MAG: hypothetical protein DRO39_03715 [Thermoprotei archaeon]